MSPVIDVKELQLGLLQQMEQLESVEEQLAQLATQRERLCEAIQLQRGAIWHATELLKAEEDSPGDNNDLSAGLRQAQPPADE